MAWLKKLMASSLVIGPTVSAGIYWGSGGGIEVEDLEKNKSEKYCKTLLTGESNKKPKVLLCYDLRKSNLQNQIFGGGERFAGSLFLLTEEESSTKKITLQKIQGLTIQKQKSPQTKSTTQVTASKAPVKKETKCDDPRKWNWQPYRWLLKEDSNSPIRVQEDKIGETFVIQRLSSDTKKEVFEFPWWVFQCIYNKTEYESSQKRMKFKDLVSGSPATPEKKNPYNNMPPMNNPLDPAMISLKMEWDYRIILNKESLSWNLNLDSDNPNFKEWKQKHNHNWHKWPFFDYKDLTCTSETVPASKKIILNCSQSPLTK